METIQWLAKVFTPLGIFPILLPWGVVSFDLHNMQPRSEEHTSELQSLAYLVCRLLLEKKKKSLEHSPRAPSLKSTGSPAESTNPVAPVSTIRWPQKDTARSALVAVHFAVNHVSRTWDN